MVSFYDAHADAFSVSRVRIWPHVKEFLDSLPAGARVLDLGCGNGKNMNYRKDLCMIGLEPSAALCTICETRNLQVVQGTATCLPFQDYSFDAVIMIAVIHHIEPMLQTQVLKEIKRVLRCGGKCLITNWAVEQPLGSQKCHHRQFHPGLNMVVWKGKDEAPLPYWILDKEGAEEFRTRVNDVDGLVCTNVTWDAGNWEFWIAS
jgi:ubiquinone/menaquinone biosynthesis C-methylase UbiE